VKGVFPEACIASSTVEGAVVVLDLLAGARVLG
jgi:hypothetical protein